MTDGLGVLRPRVCRFSARPVLPVDPWTHYVIVRADLPAGAAAAQLIHAAGESSPGHLPPGTYAIALACPNERALVLLADQLRLAGVSFRCIFETDAPWNGQLMAIGIEPGPRSKLRKLLSSLPLYRGASVGVDERSRLVRADAVSTTATGT